jgi:hypothetical protein
MVTLITRPRPVPVFQGATGAERMAKRLAWLAKERGDTPPTKETRQNYRAALRKARKMYPRKVKA